MNAINQISNELSYDYVMKHYTTTSARVRYLNSHGMSRSEISKVLNIRYQHVRNILITPIKRQS